MKSNHYLTIGILLGALATIVGGLDHWGDALKPSFVAGSLGVLGAVLKAMYQAAPHDTAAFDRTDGGWS